MGEDQHVGTDSKQPVVRLATESCSVCGSDFAPVSTQLDEQPAQQDVKIPPYVLLVMTLGGVSAVHYFMWLCFQKPDAANIIIPLIFIPVVQFLLNRYTKRKTNEPAKISKR